MSKLVSLSPLEIFKIISIVMLLALPPWLNLTKYIKSRINRFLFVILFIIYIIATLFTQNILPFIVVIITLIFINKTQDDRIVYFLRPLGENRSKVILYSFMFKVVISIIDAIFVSALTAMGLKLQGQEISNVFLKSSGFSMFLLLIMMVIIAPILEEFVFRHILYRGLGAKIGKISAAIITSLLFMLLHFNIAGSIAFFGVGLYNCYLYDKYGYRAAVTNHFIFNGVSALFIVLIKLSGMSI